ncbi:hypothetical protein SynA1544_01305 [Synechococcus sp. A15-44]|nr:hypothetical protein SynA1544_01305 [Synechococcus sp. A15-44]
MCRWLGYGQKEDELGGSINCKPLIDGLLMKKAVSQKQNQMVHSVEPESAPAPGLSALNLCAGWNELLVMVTKGSWSRPEEPSRDSRSGRVDRPSFLVAVDAQDALASPSTGLSWM